MNCSTNYCLRNNSVERLRTFWSATNQDFYWILSFMNVMLPILPVLFTSFIILYLRYFIWLLLFMLIYHYFNIWFKIILHAFKFANVFQLTHFHYTDLSHQKSNKGIVHQTFSLDSRKGFLFNAFIALIISDFVIYNFEFPTAVFLVTIY